ncbi:hypothetical protein [Undibacterium sp. Xuan67W]|uniref:hypothetical protein n=1 Tax=Undibacterium sp. Xuan67W TaxID=3413057 RepID=UPI003BF2188C
MSNLYRLFKDLIPEAPLLVGTVAAVLSGHCLITLPGGGQVTGRGVGTLGQTVFVRDEVIEGDAPNLTVEVIDI